MAMELFPQPPTPNPQSLVGIARLAAEGKTLEEKNQVEYLTLPSRSLLNRCQSKRVPFDWTINPYRGCEFGCHYCYARYTHEYMELEGSAFEQKIYVKQGVIPLLRQELAKLDGPVIAIGTATDPYQPAERRFGLTRQILEVMAEARGLDLSITTKSDLVVRDLELLKKIAQRSQLHVNLTITTVREELARALEPKAPRPALRLGAVARLAGEGLRTGIFAAPLVPAITDSPVDLEELFRSARDAGAQYLMVNPLFLKPCAQQQFFPFLEKQFPELVASYRRQYGGGAYLPLSYKRKLSRMLGPLREKYGLSAGPMQYEPEEFVEPEQLALF